MVSRPARTVDALGTWCPVPIRRLASAVRAVDAGSIVELVSDDPLVAVDLPAWCGEHGHELIEMREEGDRLRSLVRRNARTVCEFR